MNIRFIIPGLALAVGALALPTSAYADEGFARRSGILRAGPASNYPAIVRVMRGSSLEVYGCLVRYSWCDVSVEGDRGWFPGGSIGFQRDGQSLSLLGSAAILGLSILTFDQPEYWGSYYGNRPWYNDRRWNRGQPMLPHRMDNTNNPNQPPQNGQINPPSGNDKGPPPLQNTAPVNPNPPPAPIHKIPMNQAPVQQAPAIQTQPLQQQQQNLQNQAPGRGNAPAAGKKKKCVPPEICE